MDCCWVQLVRLGSGKLPLSACRGFTQEMQREMASIDMEHRFSHEIVGLGHQVIINNLSRDGNYNIPVFERAGFCSLVAVPIMTYRVHGILGMAYRDRKKLGRDYTELIAVIANLIGMSLNKTMLNKQPRELPKQPYPSNRINLTSGAKRHDAPSTAAEPENIMDTRERQQSEKKKKRSEDFQEHARRMKTFNDYHKSR